MNDDLKLLWMTFLDDLHFISHNIFIYLEQWYIYMNYLLSDNA